MTNTNTTHAAKELTAPVQPLAPYDFAALAAVMNSWVREVE